jgi:nuclear protein localization family protein 4
VDPSPLFLNNSFPTENRPGLHDQSMGTIVSQLGSLFKGTSSSLGDIDGWTEEVKLKIASWLSDWHLISFIAMQGILSLVCPFRLVWSSDMADIGQDEQKLLCRVATVHAHPNDTTAINELFSSPGWRTLVTIVDSSSCKFPSLLIGSNSTIKETSMWRSSR